MTAALLYRPNKQWRICAAIAAAVLLHIAAVAVANRESQPIPEISNRQTDDAFDVDLSSEPVTPQETDELPPPDFPPATDELTFVDRQTPPPRKTNTQPLVRPASWTPRVASARSGRALALIAPRPEYPFEARRQKLTGSGVVSFKIDSASGSVLDVTMAQSTGSAILDNAAISGFRRWRFKPGTPARVQTAITFTLTGAAY
jgi:TonB family protein